MLKLQQARRQQRLQALAAARAVAKQRAAAKKSKAEGKKQKAAAARLAAAAAAAATRTAAENATEDATGVQAIGARQNGAGGDQGSRAVATGPGGTEKAHSLLAHTLERGSTRRRRCPNRKYVQEVSLVSNPSTKKQHVFVFVSIIIQTIQVQRCSLWCLTHRQWLTKCACVHPYASCMLGRLET